ncbi:MAG: ABC transporter substrate-binding protein [Anaerolineales bacterium]|nr:ABC transporter substrate-binding protein [Anaerolineales bacterium]MDW8278757.1 ABC transporter substrate-binding protein [Anaerolineales bacterium]
MRKRLFSLLLSTLLVLSACAPLAAPAPVPTATDAPVLAGSTQTPFSTVAPTHTPQPIALTFMAGYKPQANLPFVGAYVAKEKGFFAENGLDVTIEHSPGRGEHVQLLVAGSVQVTTMDAATILQRRAEPGLPVVSIALIGQKGQQAFAALKESGLNSPKDWEGKTVGYKGTPPPDLYALLDAAGADVDKVNLVNVGFDPRALSEKQVDVYPLFKSNEPYLLQKWGYELTLWEAADFGVPTLGLAYVTSESYLAQNREALTRFLRAALQGIAYAQDHPEEAVEIVMKYAGPETDPAHMRYMLETELRDAQSEQGFGWQSLAQWQALAEMLTQYNALPAGLDVKAAFDTGVCEAAKK